MLSARTVFLLALVLSAPGAGVPGHASWLTCDEPFLRGDSNGDGTLDVSDPIATLQYLFSYGPTPSCLDAADVNDDESLNITDPIRALSYLFRGGPPPERPFPEPGRDEPCNGVDDDGDGIVDEGCSVPAKDCHSRSFVTRVPGQTDPGALRRVPVSFRRVQRQT